MVLFSLALCLLVLEGAVRKWVLGADAGPWSYVAYFSKDLAFGALLLLAKPGGSHSGLEVFQRWLGAGTILFSLGAAVSAATKFNLVGAALTVRAVLVLPWLALLAIPRLQRLRLKSVATLVGLLAVLNCALAVFQNRLPREHFLNRYAISQVNIVALDSGVRATGTFSYITGLEIMSSVGVWAGLVVLSGSAESWRRQLYGVMIIAAGLGCGLASVSRAPVLVDAAMLAFWLLASWFRNSLRLGGVLEAVALAALVLWAGGLLSRFSQMGDAIWKRQQDAGDTFRERVFGQIEVTGQLLTEVPFGVGLGTEQIAGNYVVNHSLTFKTFEAQFPRLVMETGVCGLLGFITIAFGAIAALQAAKKQDASREQWAVLVATQLLLIALFYTGVVFNHIASAFAWMLFAGAMGDSLRSSACVTNFLENRPSNRGRLRSPGSAYRRRYDERRVGAE